MSKRNIVTRSRRSDSLGRREFQFTREMIPAFAPGWMGAEFLRDYRGRAWDTFQSLPMPTVQDEPWRRTDIRSLDVEKLRLPDKGDLDKLAAVPDYLLKPLVGNQPAGQLLLHPGGVEHCLDEHLVRQGVVFTDLTVAERDHADILAKIMGQIVRPEEGKFAALASAMARSGVFVYVPSGTQVDAPLHSVLWGPGGGGLAAFSHILVWLDDGASLTYVHESASSSEASEQAMHAGVVEIHVGSDANLRFVELQSWGDRVWNFSHERARVGENGNLDWIFGALGSHLTKNFSEIQLAGEGATGRMSGFYFADGNQHLDHDTQQNHLAPRTTSDLLFKGALKEHGRSVWQGMIYVAPGAQKTDGYQANRNLILSPEARADSIPGLEILADDVRCTHGATVSKVDPDHLFYLLSRGIAEADAERLIVDGFFDPIMQRIPFDGVRERFQQAILDKMS